MPEAILLQPNAVYSDGALRLSLGLTDATLARERREGRLRYVRKGNRVFYFGQWVIDWMHASSVTGPSAVKAVARA